MSNFIERIQSWPEAKRKKLLIISTTLITLVIFAGWLSTLSSDFLSLNANSDESKAANVASPIEAVGSAFSSFVKDLSTDIAGLKENFGF
ncbi:MAG: hypothetical protein WCT19_00910 [Candidatus Paceibacterota bacterium]|jgi:hypothetical protein